MGLEKQSVVKIRAIAQEAGIPDVLSKTKAELIAALKIKKPEAKDPPLELPPKQEAVSFLQAVVDLGLTYRVDGQRWYMSFCGKTDEGSMDMPEAHIVACAERLVRPMR